MKRALVLSALVLSCSILTNPLRGERCEANQPTRCEGEFVVLCEEGFEVLRACEFGGCDADLGACPSDSCGDGAVDEGEECDDGNHQNRDTCEGDCTLPRCGNGILDLVPVDTDGDNQPDTIEQCDDGNTFDAGGCDARCQVLFCASLPDPLDLGPPLALSPCLDGCSLDSSTCGNGQRNVGEYCLPDVPVAFPIGHDADAIVASDFNNDSLIDFAFGNILDREFLIFLQSTPRSFSGSPQVLPAGGRVRALTAADYDLDCDRDVFVAADLENEAGLDQVIVFDNKEATFERSTLLTPITIGVNPSALEIADLNQDGILDLIALNRDSSFANLFISSPTAFIPSFIPGLAGNAFSVLARDINGDGVLDVVIGDKGGNSTSQMKLFVGALDVSTPESPIWSTTSKSQDASLGIHSDQLLVNDFDNDGDLDIMSVNEFSRDLSLLLNNGDGSFLPPTLIFINANSTSFTAADFNNDGHLDIAFRAFDRNSGSFSEVGFLFGDGTGQFPTQRNIPMVTQVGGLTAADIDNDGSLDLAFLCGNPNPALKADLCVLFGDQ